MSHVHYYISLLPVFLLVAVALFQIRLVYTVDASVWHGGSFGMFSTIDGLSMRFINVYAVANGKEQQLDLTDYTNVIDETLTIPTDSSLASLLDTLRCDEAIIPRNTERLVLRYYKATFDRQTISVAANLHREIYTNPCNE